MVDGETKFPLCWTRNPLAVMGFNVEKMMPYEKGMVCFLEKFPLMDIHELLDREGDVKNLEAYLCECLKFDLCFLVYCILY
jgi:hypothetical protein